MKLPVVLASAALLLRYAAANAGAVQIGLVNDAEFEKWNCGGPVAGLSRTKSGCENAKFDETSTCDTVIITNDSSEQVKVELQVKGPGFEQPPNHWGGMFSYGGPRCNERAIVECSEGLAPGLSCYQNLDFSPRDSGVSNGRVEVRVTGSGEPVTKSYDLSALAEYPPDLEAADQIRKAHLDELMRIPHVARVSLDNSESDIAIDVEVIHEEDIPKVERQLPPRLGGYRVEVTQKLEEGWGL